MGALAPIIAFRGWVVSSGGWLQPPHHPFSVTPWRPRGIAVAACAHGRRPAHEACKCGLYGHYTFESARRLEQSATVFGAFAAFGSVVKHTRGLRAEKGRIVAVTEPSGQHRELAEEVAALYEVPLISDHENFEEWAARWGDVLEPEGYDPMDLQSFVGAFANFGKTVQGVTSGFRTVAQQASIAAQDLRAKARPPHALRVLEGRSPVRPPRGSSRVWVQVMVSAGVDVKQITEPTFGQTFIQIDGIDGDLWSITAVKWNLERIEVPLPGQLQSIVPGHQFLELELEADVPGDTQDVHRAIKALAPQARARHAEFGSRL